MKINITVSIVSTLLSLSLFGFGSVEYANSATISGYVYAKDGTTGIDKVWVVAFGTGESGCGDWQNGVSTDSNGYYSLDVPEGTYYIFADASFLGCQPYANEYWNSTGGSSVCEQAEPVAAGVSGIDFVLDDGSAITGKVFRQSDGTTPIPDVQVAAFGTDGSDCGSFYGGTSTDANGYYCINLPAGTYRMYADASLNVNGCQPYIDEYYSTTGGTNLCEEAAQVTAGDSGVDFALAGGKIVSGKVTAGKDRTPIEQVQMVLYTDQACDGVWYGGRPTDVNGDYCVTVPPDTYYIHAEASHHVSQNYSDEWWTSGSGTLKCLEAEGIIVLGSNVPNIDFLLDTKMGLNSILLLLGE